MLDTDVQDYQKKLNAHKFILACRWFQKGLANFSILKTEYPHRTLLAKDRAEDTKIIETKDRSVTFRLPASVSEADPNQNLIEQISSPRITKFSTIATKKENKSAIFSHHSRKFQNIINSIRSDFDKAILNLSHVNQQLLDFTILIALHYLELELMQSAIFDGN